MKGENQPTPAPRNDAPLAVFAVSVALVMLFSGLGSIPLMQPDEGRNAEVAREMAATGSWLVPTLEGHPYLDKPAAYFAAVAVSLRLFGANEWGARVPSAVCGLLILAMIHAFTRRFYDKATAALALVVTATSPLILAFSRIVIMDVALGLFTVAAVLAAFVAEAGAAPDRRWHAASAVAVGCGMLVKGPVGLLVPAAVLTVFFLVDRRPRALRRVFSPINGLIAFGLFVPWFVALVRAHPEFLHYGLVEETWNRFFTPAFNRGQPFWYYGPMLLFSIVPWTLIAVPMAIAGWARRAALSSADRLLIVWTLVVVLFFSLSRTKQPGYIFTGVVAAAALVGRGLGIARNHRSGAFAKIVAGGTLVLSALAWAAAGLVASSVARGAANPANLATMRPEQRALWSMWPALQIVLLLLGTLGAVAYFRKSIALSAVAFALFPLALVTVMLPAVEEFAGVRSAKGVAAALSSLPAATEIACLDDYPSGLSFYLGKTITIISVDAASLRSNFIVYQMQSSAVRPATIVAPAERDRWLASRSTPVAVLAPNRSLSDLTAWLGPRASIRRAANDWWVAEISPAEAH